MGARVPLPCRHDVAAAGATTPDPTRAVRPVLRPNADLLAKVPSRLGFLFLAPQVSSPVHPAIKVPIRVLPGGGLRVSISSRPRGGSSRWHRAGHVRVNIPRPSHL